MTRYCLLQLRLSVVKYRNYIMASKDTHSSYVDGIKVKISEQYKPPPRIILPVSYSQRLSINDRIRKSVPQYDFTGDRYIKSSIAEWKIARKLKQEQRICTFDFCIEEMKDIDEKEASLKQALLKKEQEAEDTKNNATTSADCKMMLPSTQTQQNILIPTIAGLNPQPHNSMLDKSPFNVSDFDPDTSSPFDNMALKSINDLEELALVLNKDKSTISGKSEHSQEMNQQQQTAYQMYNYNNQQNAMLSSYSNRNGYFLHDMTTLPQPVNVNHSYSYPPGSYDQQHQQLTAAGLPTSQSSVADHRSTPNHLPQQSPQQQEQHRAIPLIMRSIKQQLDKSHLTSSTGSCTTLVSGACAVFDDICEQPQHGEQLENTFGNLEANAQVMCRGISSMGFPLGRVARACDLIGNDDKKIVEYLLVMSELMDLGFSETRVSAALVKSNNDKDKALELLLIS